MAYITASLSGGLGNQMFQLAASYSLAKDLGALFRISLKSFKGCGQGFASEKYLDTVYKNLYFENQDIPYSEEYDLKTWHYTPIKDILQEILKKTNALKINGAFQSLKYFEKREDEIRELFTPTGGWPNWLNKRAISKKYPELFTGNPDICFIGVRRGDYLKNPSIHNPCSLKYYQDAILENPASTYYIASDDIHWCKENFIGPQFHFFDIDLQNDVEQLAFMTLFKKFIIANSSFYWWGTFLTPFKIKTVVPNEWISNPYIKNWTCSFVYRDDFTIVNRTINSSS